MTNLAVTIPPDEITLGKGDPVFPALYERLKDHPRLLALAHEREQYGIQKYGQPLMTGDFRHTPTEIMNELLDAMAYMQKWLIDYPQHLDMERLLNNLILLSNFFLRIIDNPRGTSPDNSGMHGVSVVLTEDQTVADVAAMLTESFGAEWFNELQKIERDIDGNWQ